MARGQAQVAQNQLDTTNAVAGTQGAEAQGIENKLTPGYTSMMDTGYMDPTEAAAATTSEMGAASAPFQAAKFDANNTAAATHNAAGVPAQQDQLALQEGQTAGQTAAGLQQQKMTNQQAGMYGLQGEQQMNQGTMNSMYGLGPGTLQARAAGQSGDQTAMGYLGLATGQGKG
jgi:hypothetical protein